MYFIKAGNESQTCYFRDLSAYSCTCTQSFGGERGNSWENNAVFGPFKAEIKVVDVGDLKLRSQ